MRIKMPLILAIAALLPFSLIDAQQPAQKKPLDIYFLDTEGGQATLFVSPSGQSMLVDTGFPGNQGMPPAEANRNVYVLVTVDACSLDRCLRLSWDG